MEKQTAIKQLENYNPGYYENGFGDIARNSIHDFVDVDISLLNNSNDLRDAIFYAVNKEIEHFLYSEAKNFDSKSELWDAWCNEEIESDFSDIQKIIDSITN